jgi:hypothetical protein
MTEGMIEKCVSYTLSIGYEGQYRVRKTICTGKSLKRKSGMLKSSRKWRSGADRWECGEENCRK